MRYRDISFKANRILHGVLIALLLILVRVFHLSVMQYDERLEESQKPQRKAVVEPAARATIRDRFDLPLAVNKMSYQATVLYASLSEIRSIVWRKDETGRRIKIFKRKVYIQRLSRLLARELGLDAERVEDLIHSKAAHHSQSPFVIKEELTEREYYRLKALEKEWPGLQVRQVPKRHYPRGKVGADIVGYMGAINHAEYDHIVCEIKALQGLLDGGNHEETEKARRRLEELEAKAYTMHDEVGKTGIEKIYEKQLRGVYGKKNFFTDSKGRFLREVVGSRTSLPGRCIVLSLSAELQEYAEQLLAQNESLRQVRQSTLGPVKRTVMAEKEPWIKGGAIVAMDPETAEIIALATYPRFDPSDFIASGGPEQQKRKQEGIHRWFESDTHVAQIWDQQRPLERERYDDQKHVFYDESCWLTWRTYLDLILPKNSALRQVIGSIRTIAQAIDLQFQVERLQVFFPGEDLCKVFNRLYSAEPHRPYGTPSNLDEEVKGLHPIEEKGNLSQIKQRLDLYLNRLPKNYDKVLLVDLCRLAVAAERFSEPLIETKGEETLERYHDQTGSLATLLALVKENARELYHDFDFKPWREREEKNFLKTKREEEKRKKLPPKPYLHYLDRHERDLFQAFWSAHAWDFLVAFLRGDREWSGRSFSGSDQLSSYLTYFHQWHEEICRGAYQGAPWKRAYDCLERALRGLSPECAVAYLSTMRPFNELVRPLLGRYRGLRQSQAPLEKHLAAAFYPLYGFGYGRSHAYRQSTTQGSLFKLVTAYAALVQRFQKMQGPIVSPQDLNPLVIVDEVYQQKGISYVGYTEEGTPIPQLYKGGRLPRSLAHRHNGRVDIIKALEVSSNPYFSLLAGECLEHPDDLASAAKLFGYGSRTGIDLPGEIAGRVPQDLATNKTGLYAMAIGQHSLVVTPLQAAVMLAAIANGGKILKPRLVKISKGDEEDLDLRDVTVVREIFMPEAVRQILLRGLRAATLRTHQDNLTTLTHLYRSHPEAIRQFAALKRELVGKTSTSESVEQMDLDLDQGTNIYTHVWFGAIAFQTRMKEKPASVLLLKDEFGRPELIVVVYLRYGGYGKEAAPLAAQIVAKWREIKSRNGCAVSPGA